MRIALMACAVAACTMCGHALAGSAERRRKMLCDLLRGLRQLRIELGSVRNPLEYALRQTEFPLFISVANALSHEKNVSDAWSSVRDRECRRGGKADCLASDDLSALDRLFDHLGASGQESQLESLQSCILFLEESLSDAKERSAQIGKLYASLGFLAGLALAILMI